MGVQKYLSIEFDFELSTPTFIRGYNKRAEFRLSSLVGILRFWWRATMWNQLEDSKMLYQKEADIFGDTKKQSRLNFVLKNEDIKTEKMSTARSKQGILFPIHMRYIAYGVDEEREGSYIKEGSKGQIVIYARELSEKESKSIITALLALHYFGGLGSNSRDGFGSFNITSDIIIKQNNEVERISLPNSPEKVKQEIKKFLDKFDGSLPSYSAFSDYTCVFLSICNKSATNIQKTYADEFLGYRSSLDEDTNLVEQLMITGKTAVPQRAIFGLPHNYFFKKPVGGHKKVTFNLKDGRRASPLFFKVLKFGDRYVGVALVLRAKFLPTDAEFHIILEGGSERPKNIYSSKNSLLKEQIEEFESNEKWDTIYNLFLDHLNWEEIKCI